jgi:hypothetical protein
MFEGLSALQTYPDRSSTDIRQKIYERGTLRPTARQMVAEKKRLKTRNSGEMVIILV